MTEQRRFSRYFCVGCISGLLLAAPGMCNLLVAPARADVPAATSSTNDLFISPGPGDGKIAYVSARLLERLHYTHRPFDSSVSSSFLDRYLDTLDPQHMHFLQSDLDEFEVYRTNLDRLTIGNSVADTTPAFAIYSRFIQRLKQKVAYSEELLGHENFNFDTDERVAINRHDSPYPKDLAEAQQIWRQRVRSDYLLEKLALETPTAQSNKDKTTPAKPIPQQIRETLTHRYQRSQRMWTDWNHEDVMGAYLTALAHVYDPHSDYFNREQKEEFSMGMNLQLVGIGAELTSDPDGYCKIQRLLPGPASKSKKLKEGDRIAAVAQGSQTPVDIVDMSLNKVVQLIRGPKGTEVRLTIIPAEDSTARKVVSLIRDEIALEDKAAKAKIIEFPVSNGQSTRVGIIDLQSFYAPMEVGLPRFDIAGAGGPPSGQYTSADVARLLNKFKRENVSGVILDLRRNGGGSLEEAIKLTGLFIKQGPVVQVRGPDGSVLVQEDPDSSIVYDGPLVVLTSRFSASASEIVAGALQDYGRALIVGDKSTYGKGTVQNLDPLRPFMGPMRTDTSDPGALKITIRKFYRASGASTQLKGVMPDIVLPSERNYWKEVGESSLENAMEWDTIPSASFDKLNRVQPYLSELLRRSTDRVATNQDFAYIRQDIDQYQKLETDKTISLNEKERLREKQEDNARAKTREKELLSRKEPDQKVYEISLKQALMPGLPPPAAKTNSLAMKTGPGDTLVGTNSVSAGPTANPLDPAALDIDDAKAPIVDAAMDESERILLDYITLMSRSGSMLATQPPSSSH